MYIVQTCGKAIIGMALQAIKRTNNDNIEINGEKENKQDRGFMTIYFHNKGIEMIDLAKAQHTLCNMVAHNMLQATVLHHVC